MADRAQVRFLSIEVEGDTAAEVLDKFVSAFQEARDLVTEGKDVNITHRTATTSTLITVRPK